MKTVISTILGLLLFANLQYAQYSSNRLSKEEKEDFYEFVMIFSSDSIFQKNRIQFPLKVISISDDLTTIDTTIIVKESCQFIKLDFIQDNYRVQVYDNFEKILKDSDERVLAYEGIENGINESYYFKRKNNKWFLVIIEKLST